MKPIVEKPTVTLDFQGREYVTETMHRGNMTIKHHYPVCYNLSLKALYYYVVVRYYLVSRIRWSIKPLRNRIVVSQIIGFINNKNLSKMKKTICVFIAMLFILATIFALLLCISLPISLIAGKAVIDSNTGFEVILSFAWLASVILNQNIWEVNRNIGNLTSIQVSVLTITITLFVLCLIGILIRTL